MIWSIDDSLKSCQFSWTGESLALYYTRPRPIEVMNSFLVRLSSKDTVCMYVEL